MMLPQNIHIYYPCWKLNNISDGYSLIIWAFDGIHQGHYTLWKQAYIHSEKIAVLTFDPSPKAHFQRRSVFQSFASKYHIFAKRCTSIIYLIHFDEYIAHLSAEEFVTLYLAHIPIQRIIVWQDFRFWYKQQWDISTLQWYYPCEIVTWSGAKISSSDIHFHWSRLRPYLIT